MADDKGKALSPKHRVFCEEYLQKWNATDAYLAAYPKVSRDVARRNGSRLLTNADISAEITRRVEEISLSANEVLVRLTEHAKADFKEFLNIAPNGDVSLDIAKAEGKTHLIKKVTQRRTTRTTEHAEIEETVLTLELHDAQAALVQIGKHHKLFADRVEMTGKDGKDLNLQTQVLIYLPDNGRDGDNRTNRNPAPSGAAGDGA